jgi:hypothetical protein
MSSASTASVRYSDVVLGSVERLAYVCQCQVGRESNPLGEKTRKWLNPERPAPAEGCGPLAPWELNRVLMSSPR